MTSEEIQRSGQAYGVSRSARVWRSLLILLGVVYLLQVRTPLRLEVDSMALLSEGESVARGTGFLDDGVKTPFPPGYPAFLALLIKLGIAHAGVVVGFNVVLLGIGLLAVLGLLEGPLEQSENVALQIACAFLLSYVVIKHTAMPLTDVPYFGLSVCCLASLAYAERQPLGLRFYVSLFGAGLLLVGILFLRRVGVAFLPAFVWATLSRRERRHAAGPTMALFVILTIALLCLNTYTVNDYQVKNRNASTVLTDITNHLIEIGELVLNVPERLVPPRLKAIYTLRSGIGLAIGCAIFTALALRRRRICSVDVYVIFYAGIITVWPYTDSRFWLPVLPFLIAYSCIGVKAWLRSERWKPVLWAYKCAFAAIGMVALIYTTRLSFSGPDFPNRYTTGPLRATYCAALNTCQGKYEVKDVNRKLLHILQRYK